MIKWIWVGEKLPPKNLRVLTFSPKYEGHDPMRFRIMDGQFVALSKDVTHWACLIAPPKES